MLNSLPNTLNANDLKVGGVTAIEAALQLTTEAIISVRGVSRYVVMRSDQYEYLRECELEAAWLATQADRASTASARVKTMTAAEHIAEMTSRLPTLSGSGDAHTVQQTRAVYAVGAKAKADVKTKAKVVSRSPKKTIK